MQLLQHPQSTKMNSLKHKPSSKCSSLQHCLHSPGGAGCRGGDPGLGALTVLLLQSQRAPGSPGEATQLPGPVPLLGHRHEAQFQAQIMAVQLNVIT